MIVIKVNYTTDQPIIKVNYDDAPIYISTTVDATYIKVDYGTGGGGGGGAIWGDIIGTLSDQLDLQAALDAKVPYTGATGDVDLGEYELKAGQIELDQSPTGTAGVAVTRWNDTIGSTETTLKGGNVVLKNGVDLVARVVNKVTPNTTLTKAAYQAVKVSGAQGQRLAIALAQANNDNNSADTLGLVIETIPTNQEGFIMTVGNLEGINTTGSLQGETWSDGDVLYLSPTTAGAITNVKPNGSTGHIVVIGYVEYAHANNGKIYVKIMNGWELDELHNVFISSPANNDALIYESSTSLWKNKSIDTALGYTPVPSTRSLTINGTSYDLSADRTWSVGTVTSVALSVPTGLVVTSGSPITTSGTIAVGLQSGYSIPTTVKQSNWDDAYTFVSAFPSQSGNSGKYLTTDGSTLSWGTINLSGYVPTSRTLTINGTAYDLSADRSWTISTANIYTDNGTLTGDRTVTMGSNTLSFEKDILVYGMTIGRGTSAISTNTAFGTSALLGVNSGIGYNAAFGFEALKSNTSGYQNTASGYRALFSNTTGLYNTAVGTEALYNNISGQNNVAIGMDAGFTLSTGGSNVAIGRDALYSNNSSNNTAVGYFALRLNTSQNNVAIGNNTLAASTSAQYSTAIGSGALPAVTTGNRNTGVGASSLQSVNTGQYNIALGQSSGYSLTSGSYNIMIGSELGGITTGSYNTIIGTNILPAQLTANLSNHIILADGQGNMRLAINGSGDTVLGGTTTLPTFLGYKLDVQGTGRFTGNVTIHSQENPELLIQPNVITGSARLKIYNSGTTALGIHIATGASDTGFPTQLRNKIGLISPYGYFISTNGAGAIGTSDIAIFAFNSKSVSFNSVTEYASAQVAIDSTTKGFLQPRMTGTQRDAIVSPATGLSVYNTTTNTSDFYNGTSWVSLAAGNIYTTDGTLTGNRTVTLGGNTLSFTGDILVNGLTVGKGNGSLNNTAFGVDTIASTTSGFGNSAFGSNSSRFLTTGLYNSTFGLEALRSSTAGTGNSAFGYASLYSSQGNRNTSVGSTSFYSLSSGDDNTSIGGNSGRYIADGVTANTISNTSTFIGANTKALANNQSNQIVIGFNATGLGSNTTVIGNSSITDTAIYGRTLINYSSPTPSTYSLDVNGTGRFTGQVTCRTLSNSTGATDYSIELNGISTTDATTRILINCGTLSSTGVGFGARIINATVSNYGVGTFITNNADSSIGHVVTANSGTLIVPAFAARQNGQGTGGSIGYTWMSGNSQWFWHSLYNDGTYANLRLSNRTGDVYYVRDRDTTNISFGSSTYYASAQLAIDSTTKGFLPPRMTETQKNAISTPATGLVIYQTDGTEGLYERTSTAWRLINASGSGGSGITRSVNNISTTTTAGSAASTDYVYLISGTTTLTLPTAVGNTNRYTLKNVGTNTVTINTTSSQTIDGSTSITMAVRYTALDVISDGTNWNII